MEQPASSPHSPSALFVVTFCLVCFNLRPALTAQDPLLELISSDLHLTTTATGLFALLPIFILGIAATLAPWLNRRFSTWSLILWSPVLALVGCLIRSYGGVFGLYTGMVLIGLGLGITGTAVPGWIKRLVPQHSSFMMGAYSGLVGLGTAVSAATSIPLVRALGSWSHSLVFWSIPLFFGVILCALSEHRFPDVTSSEGSAIDSPSLWGNARAWQISLFYASRVAAAYFFFTWLTELLQDRGVSNVDAGYLLSLATLAQIPASILTHRFAQILGGTARLVVVAFSASALSCWGIIYLDSIYLIPLSIVIGIGTGTIFSRGMSLMVERARNSSESVVLSGMAQGVGFTLGALLALGGSYFVHQGDSSLSFCLIYTTFSVVGIILGAYSERPGVV